MRALRLLALAVLIAAPSARLFALTEDQKRAMDNFVIVAFAMDVGQDGRFHNIRLVRCENPSDQKVLKGALTPAEIQNGIQIIASEQVKRKPSDYGKTMYRALVFDKRVRRYIKKT